MGVGDKNVGQRDDVPHKRSGKVDNAQRIGCPRDHLLDPVELQQVLFDEQGLAGKVKLGTFDLSPAILQAIVDGKMEWGIDAQQYLMGYVPVVMFDLKAKYKLTPILDYPTGPGFVTKDEAASVIELAKQGKR